MNPLLQQIMGALDPATVQSLAGRMQTSPEQAQAAIGQAMPALLSALGQHASTPGGADALHAAALSGSPAADVQALLTQVFAGAHIPSVGGMASATGLQTDQARQLLAAIGPSVLMALGQHAAQNGIGAQGLAGLLSAAAQHAQSQPVGFGSLLGSLFNRI
ncbi:MAG: DUF937 domain-containing protein [Proteobacteria bacterium]|nr:DUF937 domain-containing protein [Pseudomonadota bacterium]